MGGPDTHTRITWLLVAGLLFLRIPFLAGMLTFVHTWRGLVVSAFEIGTYFLSALLIVWERDHLSDFHFDKLGLAIFILGKPYELLLERLRIPFDYPMVMDVHALYLPIALGLLIALLLSRPRLPRLRARDWRWVLIGALAGIAFGVLSGSLLRLQSPGGLKDKLTTAILISLPLQQMVYAGIAEEPLFRGFLWGSLRKKGWKDAWICILQAGLFGLGHLYYLNKAPLSFWVIVPLSGLVFGLLAWRSRSVAVTMVAHGFGNAVAQMVAHYQL